MPRFVTEVGLTESFKAATEWPASIKAPAEAAKNGK